MFFLLMMTDPFQFPSFYLDPLLLSLPLSSSSSSTSFLSLSFSFSKTANNDDDDDNRADNDNVDDYDDNDGGVAKRRHAPSLSSLSSSLSPHSFT